MNHQFSSLQDIHSENSFISSDAYLQHSKLCGDCHYQRSDAIFFKRIWRGGLQNSLVSATFKEKKANLLLGHSDELTGVGKVLLLRLLGYPNVAGINVVKFKDISIPLPIGITNNTNESDYHRLFGNNELLMKANQLDFLTQSNGLVYGCFSTETNPRERMPLAKLLSRSKHIFDEPVFSIDGRVRYLENLRRYAFTACPVGNGIDTHRLWEVLYMGGIPIIKKNEILESLLEDLPFVLVEEWDQINDDAFLQDSWDRLAIRAGYNFDKLRLNFWINLIHSR
jgi:hypothetical protein